MRMMGGFELNLKLRIISLWMPEFILIHEIDRVARITIECLNELLSEYAPENMIWREEVVMKGNISQRRRLMANAHNIRVKTLIDTLGCEDALKIGRRALFKAGLQLGEDARIRLGVSDSLSDLLDAARILYRVLGIEFHIEEEDGKWLLIVDKCSLSSYYTVETCIVLSAADEGVVQGLNKDYSMIFKDRITEGKSECHACIKTLKIS
jgi:hypothetical protein